MQLLDALRLILLVYLTPSVLCTDILYIWDCRSDQIYWVITSTTSYPQINSQRQVSPSSSPHIKPYFTLYNWVNNSTNTKNMILNWKYTILKNWAINKDNPLSPQTLVQYLRSLVQMLPNIFILLAILACVYIFTVETVWTIIK